MGGRLFIPKKGAWGGGNHPTRLDNPVLRRRAANPGDIRRAGDLKQGEAPRIWPIATPAQFPPRRRAVAVGGSIQFTARSWPFGEVGRDYTHARRADFPRNRGGFVRSCMGRRRVPNYTPSPFLATAQVSRPIAIVTPTEHRCAIFGRAGESNISDSENRFPRCSLIRSTFVEAVPTSARVRRFRISVGAKLAIYEIAIARFAYFRAPEKFLVRL